MKFGVAIQLFALCLGDESSDTKKFIKDSINKIPEIDAPSNVDTQNLDQQGPIQFTTKSFHEHQETFVLIKSSTKEFTTPYNIIATIRTKTGLRTTFFDHAYEGRIFSSDEGNGQFKIKIADIATDDLDYYLMFSMTDPFDGSVTVDVDNKMYTANTYTGTVGAKFITVGGDRLLVAYQESSRPATISTGLPTRALSADERSTAQISASASAVVIERPNDDWFQVSANRDNKYMTISTAFSNIKVLRFSNKADVLQKTTPVLVGWQIDFSCGPVPSDADEVELVAGSNGEISVVGRASVSSMTRSGDNLEFNGMEAKSDMTGKKGGLACRFFSNDGRDIGITTPTAFSIHDTTSPRPNFEANFLQKECGLEDGVVQEVAECKVPDGEQGNVFPPVFLQWRMTRYDGSEVFQPEEPIKTMYLALNINVTEQADSGATFTCIDWRMADPRSGGASWNEDSKSTTPLANNGGFRFREKTELPFLIDYENKDHMCQSREFAADTINENPCSDIASWEEPVIDICQSTKSVGTIKCTANLVNGGSIEQTWKNDECKDVNEIEIPCEMSTVAECNHVLPDGPNSESQEGEAHASNSKIWLLFFAIAAIGGAILIFINKRSKAEPKAANAESDEKDEESLLNEPVAAEVRVEDETAKQLSSSIEPTAQIPFMDEAKKSDTDANVEPSQQSDNKTD